jgi:hypothetical protein
MTRGRRVAQLAVAAALIGTAAMMMRGASAQASTPCSDFSAVSAADGARVVGSTPGLSPTDVDGQGPAAQAQVDSNGISTGFAGAPYSEAAAGNAGAGNVDATKVPVFAISSYPSAPTGGTSTPAASVEAKSEALASTAKAVAGGSGSSDPSSGRSSTTAASSCAEDNTVTAKSENLSEVVSFSGGVLRLGSVRSNASAVVSGGNLTLTGTMVVEGATILGQAVSITDQGLVAGSTPSPLPANPLTSPLKDAGISVRVIAAVKDPARGQVVAPGLEVTVAKGVAGVGSGPATTTYTYGRAYARAGGKPSDLGSPTVSVGSVSSSPTSRVSTPASSRTSTKTTPASGTAAPTTPKAPAPAAPAPIRNSTQVANASLASVYPAVAAGAAVLAAAWLLFKSLGVRLRWI